MAKSKNKAPAKAQPKAKTKANPLPMAKGGKAQPFGKTSKEKSFGGY